MDSDRLPTQKSIRLLLGEPWKKTSLLLCLAVFGAGCVSTGELPEHANIQGPLPQDVAIRSYPGDAYEAGDSQECRKAKFD
jgi:hypothetical protein